jgi:hypothetical protein
MQTIFFKTDPVKNFLISAGFTEKKMLAQSLKGFLKAASKWYRIKEFLKAAGKFIMKLAKYCQTPSCLQKLFCDCTYGFPNLNRNQTLEHQWLS